MDFTEDDAYAVGFSYCSDIPAGVFTTFNEKIGRRFISSDVLLAIGIDNPVQEYSYTELMDILKEPYREQIRLAILEMLMVSV